MDREELIKLAYLAGYYDGLTKQASGEASFWPGFEKFEKVLDKPQVFLRWARMKYKQAVRKHPYLAPLVAGIAGTAVGFFGGKRIGQQSLLRKYGPHALTFGAGFLGAKLLSSD